MSAHGEIQFKEAHRKLLKWFFGAVSLILFVGGFALRFWTQGHEGLPYEIAREAGTFISVAIAVGFVYDRFIREEDRRMLLSDLRELLSDRDQNGSSLRVFEHGRPSLQEKMAVVAGAKKEVIEVGTALRTFKSYFESHTAREFKEPVLALIKSGVVFRCLLMSPKSQFALQNTSVLNSINTTIEYLVKFRKDENLGEKLVSVRSSTPSNSMHNP